MLRETRFVASESLRRIEAYSDPAVWIVRVPEPDALARVWAALQCPTSGHVLLSAEPAYEFPDWGRRAHVRGGSHGSLHRVDSLGALLFCGVEAPPERIDGCWSIADIAPMVLGHFGAKAVSGRHGAKAG